MRFEPRTSLRSLMALVLSRQFLLYVVAGLINTGLGLAAYSICVLVFDLDYRIASFITMLVGVTAGFFQSRHTVFGTGATGCGLRYIALFGLMYLVSIAGIGVLLDLGLNEIEAYALLIPVVLPLSFLVQKYWVFRVS